MDKMEYRIRMGVLRTAIGPKELFEDFVKNGINEAKGAILKALKENPEGLDYLQLENLVMEFFSDKEGKNDAWKQDAFMVALAGLELEDDEIKDESGIYTLLNKEMQGG